MSNIALIVAAGRGTRLGADSPKQYVPLAGKPILRRTVDAFASHDRITNIRVVIHIDDRDHYRAAVAGMSLLDPVIGGESRQDSVRRGLESLADEPPQHVLIHDAARPFVDAETITATLDALRHHTGAIPALPVPDSLKRVTDKIIEQSFDRRGIWRAQTPQAFHFAEILAAHRACNDVAATDDAAVAAEAGLEVAVVPGTEDNLKITDCDDLARAERILTQRLTDVRVGNGFDVHRFEPGDHIMLCGIRVPHDAGLQGHSDADVGLHALTDAILGALGAGDIGQHFPPSDPTWRNVSSDRFLRQAGSFVAEAGGSVAHVDLTLILERPKVGPHRDAMRARIAEILGIDSARVSVKATTTERLGFLGRGEGVAAQATATIRLPGI